VQVRIGRKALALVGGDEAMIAALLAHALAHAALDHETGLGLGSPATASVRRTEREADRLSEWLLANLGYDPEAALPMIRRVRPGGLLVVASPATARAIPPREK